MTDTEKQHADDNYERLRRACQVLIEHFDAVQIFASRDVAGSGTLGLHCGVGNFYTRRGQVSDWIVKQDEVARMEQRGED